jgi:hypothetical protein
VSGYVFATTATSLALGGNRIVIRPGETWASDDPLVTAYPSCFAAAPDRVRSTDTPDGYRPLGDPAEEGPVERGTRAPGEKRGTKRGR